MEQASIVYSPNNYFIDQRIRRSMKIELRGNIIMLDETHNIKNSAREATSGTNSAGLMNHLENCKAIVCESRRYEAVNFTDSSPPVTGS
jgi:Fanconi anemia group J protein